MFVVKAFIILMLCSDACAFRFDVHMFAKRVNTEICGREAADVIFILDESSSIYHLDFAKQLSFVQDAAEVFQLDEGQIRVAVMTFADKPKIRFNLGDVSSFDELKSAIRKIDQTTGNTFTADAINSAMSDMFVKNGRVGVPKIAILITDGESENTQRTAEAAKNARDAGILIFAIGVGQNLREELELIASQPVDEYVYTVGNYSALKKISDSLEYKICIVTTPKPPTTTPPQTIEGCEGHGPLDLVFALPDQEELPSKSCCIEFVSDIMSDMKLSADRAQVGVTPGFCSLAREVKLHEHDTQGGLVEVLSQRWDKSIFTEHHLRYIHSEGFTSKNGGRPNAVKVAVLIVNGKSDSKEDTLWEADLAKNDGIKLLVIGIGDNVDKEEVRSIASSVDGAFFANNCSQLKNLLPEVKYRVCEELLLGEEETNYYDYK